MININEYCKAVNEKIELNEEIVIDLRADIGKARETTTHFYRTIRKLKEIYFKKDTKKSEVNSQKYLFVLRWAGKRFTPSLKKEKHELKIKLLAQRPIIQHIGIKGIDVSSYIFYENYYEATILAH